MTSPVDVARAVDAVEHLERELESPDAQWFSPLEVLIPFVRDGTIDAMYAAMSRKLKSFFLSGARLQFWAFDAIVAECLAEGEDPAGWIALREWVCRQPFDVNPSLPLPSPEEVNRLGIVRTFVRILPHFATNSVEEVLDTLHPAWRERNLAQFATGMRPRIDVILETCRAHGQDPTPFVKLREWEASLPKA